ncbi:MAG: hemolysin family protein [Egibacteraceae bacterium]
MMGLQRGDLFALLAALALVLVAAFFGAAQTALSRMSLLRARRLESAGQSGARRLVALMEDPAKSLNISALLALVAEVLAVALFTVALDSLLQAAVAVVVVTVVASAALFVGSEVAPKTVAVQRTERVACLVAPVVRLLARPLGPVTDLLILAGNLLAPGKGLASGPFVTEDQLREMIDTAESEEVIESTERAMIHSIFELGDTIVREIMVPRPDMVLVSSEEPLRAVLDVILRAGHSRIPVYAEDRDQIVGLVYAKDVLRRLHARGDEEGAWSDLMRRAYFVPELKPVDELLRELQAEKVHLALVVDEYGGIAGVVTIEDILEEIVGEIVDEYDREEAMVEELDGDRWRIDARLPVDKLDELVEADLPKEEWDTVGGLLFGLLGHVPTPGEEVAVDGLRLVAERVKGRRIAEILVERQPEESAAGAAAAPEHEAT